MAAARDLLGAHALLAGGADDGFAPGTDTHALGPNKPPTDLAHPGWYDGFLFSPALTIGGGTGEVQRNIVGELVLGLPREVDVQAGLAWADAQRAQGTAT
jgi:hypothetical protein